MMISKRVNANAPTLREALRGFAPASINTSITKNLFLKKKVQEEVKCQNRSEARLRDRSEARLRDRSVARLRDRSVVRLRERSEASKWLGRSCSHTSCQSSVRAVGPDGGLDVPVNALSMAIKSLDLILIVNE